MCAQTMSAANPVDPAGFSAQSAVASPDASPDASPVAAAAHTAHQRTADAIQSIMFGGAFDGAAWRQVETFASEKAREMRTERLKRGSHDARHDSSNTLTNLQPRKILKIKRK